MASNSSKTSPSLSKCKTYDDWLKLIKILHRFTDLPDKQHGSAIVLSLEDKALDVDTIINRLNKLFKNHTHVRRWGTPQNFCFAFIDELEKQLFIKKTVEVGQEKI